jgi:hypothetical protein
MVKSRTLVEIRSLYRYKKTFWLFIAFSALYLLINAFHRNFIFTHEYFYETLGEKLSINTIDKILHFQDKWSFVGYFFMPIILIIKYFLITFCLEIGLSLSGYNIGYKKLLPVVIISDIVFLLGIVINTTVFLFLDVNTLIRYQTISSYSIGSLLNIKEMDPWLIYPLQNINIFEIFYCILLSIGISFLIKADFRKSLKLTVGSYGIGLAVWFAFVMFLLLRMN